MNARKVIVGGIFVLIAFVGASALVAPFVGGWDTVFRVIAIGVVGTVAGLGAIPLAMLAGRPALRPGAIGGLVVLGIEALLLCVSALSTHYRTSESMATLALAGALPLLLAVASLFVLGWRPMRGAAIVGLVIAAISYGLIVVAIAGAMIGGWPGRGEGAEELLLSGLLLALAGKLILAACTRRADEPAWPGAICSLAPIATLILSEALMLGYAGQWRPATPDTLEALVAVAWPVASGLSLWRLMRLARLRDLQALLPGGFLAATIAGGALMSWGLDIDNELTVALGASSLVLAGCIMVAVAVLAWLQRRVEIVERMASIAPGTLPCPRCRESIEIRPGGGQCAACGLHYKLSLEAPLCRRCRHDLAHVTSAVCPECGEPVRLSAANS